WDRAKPLVVHCYAGISRSTASAYIIAAALAPKRDEVELAQTLRTLSPSATPNPRLIAVADALLGRDGRMIAAIEAIGRGADAFEGIPFELKIEA
ncbi:MAG: protein tyrosine phosphatase, partial [Mesorhizobium sp.]